MIIINIPDKYSYLVTKKTCEILDDSDFDIKMKEMVDELKIKHYNIYKEVE